MALITKNTVQQLADVHALHCVSIYLSTHKFGKEVKKGEDAIKLKNALKEARRKLAEYELSESEIRDYLKPAEKIIDDSDFWSHLSQGLAIFINKEGIQYFISPQKFDEVIYVSNHYYLKPLMSLFNDNGRFFILAISQDNSRFFECSPYSISEVFIESLIPERLEDSVGYDYEDKSLQWRSDQVGGAPDINIAGGIFHGHGKAKDKKKDEILEFCRDIDKGVMNLLHDEDAPLLIACVEYIYPIYKEANTYQHLFGCFTPGNPDYIEQGFLHDTAVNMLKEHFEKGKTEKLNLYRETVKRTSSVLSDIIVGAVNGRVDTLFINNKAELWGQYDKETARVILQKEKSVNNVSLIDLAAVDTFLQNGKVFVVEPQEMPESETLLNAIFRY